MASKKCTSCHNTKPLTDFRIRTRTSSSGQKGDHTAKCDSCLSRDSKKRKAKEDVIDDIPSDMELTDIIPLLDFLSHIRKESRLPGFSVKVRVDVSSLEDFPTGNPSKEQAALISDHISKHIKFCWTYVIY